MTDISGSTQFLSSAFRKTANGAGKTSIYESVYYKENIDEKRINTDEMVARIGSWKDNNIQMKCE